MREQTPIDRTDAADESRLNRRGFLGVSTGLGVTLLAGCSAQSDEAAGDGDGGGTSEGSTGTFRLLISDQPVAIDEFDSLNVSFDRARIFRGEAEDDEQDDSESEEANETEPNETETDGANETQTNETEPADSETEAMDDESDEEGESDDGAGGFSIIDLDGATVDLTEVVGDKAIGVFEGELEAGQYSKIELYASNVEGIVDGDSVEVMIPSGKLQIVKPFEIVPDEPVSFVFDINVVKKGNQNEYNLLPVISESGVAGKDVEVEEVGGDGSEGDAVDGAGTEAGTDAGDDADDTDRNGTGTDSDDNETSVDGQ